MNKMKFKIAIVAIMIVALLASCSADKTASDKSAPETESIYDVIVLDGENTHIKDLTAGMTVDEVLSALGHSEDEYTIDTYTPARATDNTEVTDMIKKENVKFDEFEYDFMILYRFTNGSLERISYGTQIDIEDTGKAYDTAHAFMESFIEKTGAVPLENAEGFEYHIYGSDERESFMQEGGHYNCQFFNGGVLGEISMSNFDPSYLGEKNTYKNKIVISLNILTVLERNQMVLD